MIELPDFDYLDDHGRYLWRLDTILDNLAIFNGLALKCDKVTSCNVPSPKPAKPMSECQVMPESKGSGYAVWDTSEETS